MNVRQVVPKDAIPSVDAPSFSPVDQTRTDDHLDPDEDLIVVDPRETSDSSDAPDEVPRGYPVRYLNYHEIVNDTVGGTPVAVTWCPLCASAIIYDRTVGGRPVEFGVSGKLADDDLVMYDRATGSEWKQSRGVAIAGPRAGDQLRVLPSTVTSFGSFREATPDGLVLDPPGGKSEASGQGSSPDPIDYDANPYTRYFSTEGFGLAAHRGTGSREWSRDDIDPKAVVLGVEIGDEALGFPLPVVSRRGGVVTSLVGGDPVVVFHADGIHAFRAPADWEWEAVADGFRADRTTWDGVTGRAADGRQLQRLPGKRLFAFAWQDDHGPDAFYGL